MRYRRLICVFAVLLMFLQVEMLSAGGNGEGANGNLSTGSGESRNSLDSLSDSVLDAVGELPAGTTAAVLHIRNANSRNSALGNYMENHITRLLVEDSGLTVVERRDMESISSEWNLVLTGVVDGEGAAELGRVAGADTVVVGMLTESEDGILVNLRFLDTTSSKVLIAVDGIINEEQYRAMYSDIESLKILTDEDFYIGLGRDFDRGKALTAAFIDLCRVLEKEFGEGTFLDSSFVEYLSSTAEIRFTSGSRENCTIRVEKRLLTPSALYRYFFEDGRSSYVLYFDESNYGWMTNPWFMKSVEQEYDTLGVPEIYRNAAMRYKALGKSPPTVQLPEAETGKLTSWGYGPSSEWAAIAAAVDMAMQIEARIESVSFRENGEWVEFNASYSTLENIRLAAESATVQARFDNDGFHSVVLTADMNLLMQP